MNMIIKINYKVVSIFLFLTILLSSCLIFAQQDSSKAVVNTIESKSTFPVIMYHFFTNDNRNNQYLMSKKKLIEDLNYINENYTPVNVKDLINFKNGGLLPAKPIVITIDDSSVSFYHIMYPLIKEMKMKVVLSVLGKNSDLATDDNNPNESFKYHMTWSQLKEVEHSGFVELQNHSYDLHDYGNGKYGCKKYPKETTETYLKRIEDDLKLNNKKIYELNKIMPTTFTYPLGYICDGSQAILKKLSMQASFSCYEKLYTIDREKPDTLFEINRFNRNGSMSTKTFFSSFK